MRSAKVPRRRPARARKAEDGGGRLGDVLQFNLKVSDDELTARAVSTTDGAVDPYWTAATWQVSRWSVALFASDVLSGDPNPPYLGRFLIGEHHQEWDELVTTYKRLCVLAPRDHGKTWFFDFALPIWYAFTRPGSVIYIFSATQDQADRILDDIKVELENNPRLNHLVPLKKKRWSARRIQLDNGSVLYARGFGTKVRGAHPDLIICDDVLNDETAFSETVRKKEKDYFFSAISNMVRPTGQIVVVGTPFAENDLYGELKRNARYKFRRYQAINEVTRKALWPERYSVKALEEKRLEIGTLRFSREFQCVAVSDDMSLFPSHLFRGSPVEQPHARLGMPLSYWREAGIVSTFMGVDFGLSAQAGADYTVLWIEGLDQAYNRWLLEIIRERGLPYHEQKSLLVKYGRLYDVDLMFLEANQAQRIFGDELIRETDLPVKHYTTGAEKHSLEKGLPSLRILLENKKFRIPRGDLRSVELTEVWVSEMRAFTFEDGRIETVADHDDTPMACWLCEQAVKQGGFGFTFGEDGDGEALDIDTLYGLDDGKGNGPAAAPGQPAKIPEGMLGGALEDDRADPLVDEEIGKEKLWRAPIGGFDPFG